MGQPYGYTYDTVHGQSARFSTDTFDPKAVTRASWQQKPERPKQEGPFITPTRASQDSRFYEKDFDPKAFERASWEPKPQKPKPDGPLVSFNTHPDMHQLPPSDHTRLLQPMSPSTKKLIVWMRKFQLALRVFELVAGIGLLGLMILITNVNPLTAWILRITGGVIALCCGYAIYHLSRPAGKRPPTSSTAYHLFAGFTDLAVLPLYAFGVLSVNNYGKEWTTMIPVESVVDYLVSALYYLVIVAGGLHIISLALSAWLSLMFRRIAKMPPDMNPLENHLTSRRHKRNKSSVATNHTSMSDSTLKRLSTPLEGVHRSGDPYEDLARPPSIPFMHTRAGSRESIVSSKRDSRVDLPSRQYQITPRNSPRNSIVSTAEAKRLSRPPPPSTRGSYTEISLHDDMGGNQSDPNSPAGQGNNNNASPARVAKFTEAWYTSESLINRTEQRKRAMMIAGATAKQQQQQQQQQRQQQQEPRTYEALTQRYEEDSDYDDDMDRTMIRLDPADVSDLSSNSTMHPNPLRSHPTPELSSKIPRTQTRYRANREPSEASTDSDSDNHNNNYSHDIADERLAVPVGDPMLDRGRNSSIQPEDAFYSKPYGELRAGTPPIMIGGTGGRQVSSGNDYGYDYDNEYDLGGGNNNRRSFSFKFRRSVSGKVAEEGRAGHSYSRYSVLNE